MIYEDLSGNVCVKTWSWDSSVAFLGTPECWLHSQPENNFAPRTYKTQAEVPSLWFRAQGSGQQGQGNVGGAGISPSGQAAPGVSGARVWPGVRRVCFGCGEEVRPGETSRKRTHGLFSPNKTPLCGPRRRLRQPGRRAGAREPAPPRGARGAAFPRGTRPALLAQPRSAASPGFPFQTPPLSPDPKRDERLPLSSSLWPQVGSGWSPSWSLWEAGAKMDGFRLRGPGSLVRKA